MLWALFFSLIFSGGEETIVINTELKQLLRNNISQEEKKEYALNLTKSYMREVKSFDKVQKKRRKELSALFKERSATAEDFAKLYEEYISDLIIIENKGLEGREKLCDMLTEDEWKLILKSIELDAAKIAEKKRKKRIKMSQKAEKNKMKAVSHLKDSHKKQVIEVQLDGYSTLYLDYVKYRDELNYHSNDVLKLQHSSTSELSKLLNERTLKRKKVFNEFIELHRVIVQNATENEWNGVTRKINRMY